MDRQREYIHSWYVLIMTVFSLLFILINKKNPMNFAIVSAMLFVYFKNGLELKRCVKVIFYSLLFSGSIFLLAVLNPGKHASFDKALLTMQKVFLVSFLSICSSSAIDYTKVILHLIVHKGLKLIWGYPFMLAINSIALLKDEYERIKLNARLRNLPLKDKIFLFFPLLVFAIRHSQRGALSLVTRGLSESKTFYFSYDLSLSDKKKLLIFWLYYFALVVVTQFPLR